MAPSRGLLRGRRTNEKTTVVHCLEETVLREQSSPRIAWTFRERFRGGPSTFLSSTSSPSDRNHGGALQRLRRLPRHKGPFIFAAQSALFVACSRTEKVEPGTMKGEESDRGREEIRDGRRRENLLEYCESRGGPSRELRLYCISSRSIRLFDALSTVLARVRVQSISRNV